MKLISKIDRIAAWILAACFIIFMVTGLDMQLRFLAPTKTSLIHLNYLFIIAQLAFMVHTTYAFHLRLKAWKFWQWPGKILLGIYFGFNLALIVVFISSRF